MSRSVGFMQICCKFPQHRRITIDSANRLTANIGQWRQTVIGPENIGRTINQIEMFLFVDALVRWREGGGICICHAHMTSSAGRLRHCSPAYPVTEMCRAASRAYGDWTLPHFRFIKGARLVAHIRRIAHPLIAAAALGFKQGAVCVPHRNSAFVIRGHAGQTDADCHPAEHAFLWLKQYILDLVTDHFRDNLTLGLGSIREQYAKLLSADATNQIAFPQEIFEYG